MANKSEKTGLDTFAKQSEKNKLEITLKQLDAHELSYGFPRSAELDRIFCDLTVYTPTTQSHQGEKFSSFPKLNNHTLNAFLEKVFNSLEVKNVYLYQSYTTHTRNKHDLFEEVARDQDTMLCLRCDSGVKTSLYKAVRNAIAHGNIAKQGDFYVLYSVADDAQEYESSVTFFLRIRKLEKLKALIQILNYYR